MEGTVTADVVTVEQQWPPKSNAELDLPEGLALNFPALYLHYALATPAYVPAVVSCRHPELSCTYGSLNAHVVRLAIRLREEFDVKDGRPVAVLMEKSPRYVVALLATLLAGGSYVPLSPSDPPSLRTRVATDCGIAAAFLGPGLSLPGVRVIHVEEELELLPPLLDEEIATAWAYASAVEPGDQACLVYSSGTTGNPKGIAIPHRALVACYTWRFSKPSIPSAVSLYTHASLLQTCRHTLLCTHTLILTPLPCLSPSLSFSLPLAPHSPSFTNVVAFKSPYYSYVPLLPSLAIAVLLSPTALLDFSS